MAEITISPDTENRTSATSPPPNCAICLDPCTNKCFSDSCMHQFCFKCLLEWSKIKAVCPLCKQSFNSIIHNVKSNEEYDEHHVERPMLESLQALFEDNDYDELYLPPTPPSRHFQFRTTFTVDPRGELAIQQMLLTHPLTNSVYIPGHNPLPRFNRYHRRRELSSTAYRRSIYYNDLWASVPPADITGRYRDCTPTYFRENPASRNRLVPWLNRELNALLEENTQQVMHLVDVILTYLPQHHIRSAYFRNMLNEYLDNKTDHFIHEFYTFMRSPYDMIGYDRHVSYYPRPRNVSSPIELLSDHDSDSDVVLVSGPDNTNALVRPTLEVIEINSSDGESVIFVDSESQENNGSQEAARTFTTIERDSSEEEENRKPTILPPKLRLKNNGLIREREPKEKESKEKPHKERKSRLKRRHRDSSRSSSTSSSDREDTYVRTKKYKKKYRKSKYKSYKSKKSSRHHFKRIISSDDSSTDDEPLLARQNRTLSSDSDDYKRHDSDSEEEKMRVSDSDDYIPLAKLKSKEKRKKSKKSRKEKTQTVTSSNCQNLPGPSSKSENQVDTKYTEYTFKMSPRIPSTSYYGNHADLPISEECQEYNTWATFQPKTKYEEQNDISLPSSKDTTIRIKNEVKDYEPFFPGPSSGKLRSVIVKKENSKDLWYSRPCITTDSSDED